VSYVDYEEILSSAKEYFNDGNYKAAEPLLNQLILKGCKYPDVFHMLGTIFYDQSKFSKAIRSFKRALEMDPTFTDASVGLSIVLNDLGRYEEGRAVFEQAQKALRKKVSDPFVDEKLAMKHDELGDVYRHYNRQAEAMEQYEKAWQLTSSHKLEIKMKIVDCLEAVGDAPRAVDELKNVLKDNSQFIPGRLKLGQLYYRSQQIALALQEWERVLAKDPQHPQALRFIRQAEEAGVTRLDQQL
jgi:tetratricopeptide (TPR) repeat protein